MVRKNGVAAIAADTLTTWGDGKESATYIANSEKIIRIGDSYLGCTGPTAAKYALTDYFSGLKKPADLSGVEPIFRTWLKLHTALKESYFLRAEEEADDAFESSRTDVVIANAHGIFGVAAHRTVQEFLKFYAFGSGYQVALGAIYAAYDDPERDAEALARLGVEAAAEFDSGTGAPIQSFTVPLLPRRNELDKQRRD